MEVKFHILCVIFYETILISSLGAVTLPFTELVATVTPRKPKQLSPEAASQVPVVPKSSDAILEYYKSEFPDEDLSSLVCEFSSPLILKSCSKTLTVADVESAADRTTYPSTRGSESSTLMPKPYSSKCDSTNLAYDASTINLPASMSPVVEKSIYSNPYVKDLTSPVVQNMPMLAIPPIVSDYTSDISSFIPKAGISLPVISSLPSVSLNSLILPPRSSVSYNLSPIYSSSLSTYPSFLSPNKCSYSSVASLNPVCSVPYPLRYINIVSLPKVITPPSLTTSKLGSISYAEDKYLNTPNPSIKQSTVKFSPLLFENSYSPKVNQKIYPNPLEVSSNLYNRDLSRGYSFNSLLDYPHMRNSGTFFKSESLSSIPNSLAQSISILEEPMVNYKPYQQLIPERIPTDMYLSREVFPKIPRNPLPAVSSANTTPEKPKIHSVSSNKLSTSSAANTYVNTSPSSIKSSTINEFISDILQKVISSINSRITSHVRKPVNKMKSYSYLTRLRDQTPGITPNRQSQNSYNTKARLPVLSQPTNIQNSLPISVVKPSSISLEPVAAVPSIFDDISPKSLLPLVTDASKTIDYPAVAPLRVAVLPPTSFSDYSSLHPCPANLPSPILPPYLDFTSPLGPQVMKIKNLKKNSNTIEKLLELVFFAELLNGDDYVDWDALDTVLAMLC